MDERREEARDDIRFRVWSGYCDRGEVFDAVDEDVFGADGEDEEWLRRAVAREFRKKREAERTWPAVTDCDRLDRVFESLRVRGVLTRHRCGLTIQDGLDVIDSLYAEAGGKQSGLTGYCFYHLQDMEAATCGERRPVAGVRQLPAEPGAGSRGGPTPPVGVRGNRVRGGVGWHGREAVAAQGLPLAAAESGVGEPRRGRTSRSADRPRK